MLRLLQATLTEAGARQWANPLGEAMEAQALHTVILRAHMILGCFGRVQHAVNNGGAERPSHNGRMVEPDEEEGGAC